MEYPRVFHEDRLTTITTIIAHHRQGLRVAVQGEDGVLHAQLLEAAVLVVMQVPLPIVEGNLHQILLMHIINNINIRHIRNVKC